MATLRDVLTANTSIAQAIETKFPMLPKLSVQMTTVAGQVPLGPEIPAVAITVLQPPPPNKTGQPLADFFNGPPITGPTLPGLPGLGAEPTVQAVASRLPLSPVNPGAARGTTVYTGLQLSPTTPGAARGTILYGE